MSAFVPSVDAVDARMASLRAAGDRVGQALYDFDNDPIRQVLDSAALSGATANAWAGAPDRMAWLWQAHIAVSDLLENASNRRGTKRRLTDEELDELSRLLSGPALDLPSIDRIGVRPPPIPEPLATVDATLGQMGRVLSNLGATAAQAGEVWGTVVPRLDDLDRALDGVERSASTTGFRVPNEVVVARRQIKDLRAQVQSDPLGVLPEEVTKIASGVERVRTRATAAEKAKADLGYRTAACGADLDRTDDLLSAAGEDNVQGRVKIAGAADITPEIQAAVATAELLRKELGEASTSPGPDWEVVDRQLTALGERAIALLGVAGQLGDRAGQGLAARRELRGRLEAYRAKAQAIGRAEDLALEAVYQSAHDSLYSAPCDLEEAGRLVDRYQHSLNDSRSLGR